MKRMGDNLGSRLPCDSDEVDAMRPQPDVAKFVKGVMECLGENQRKIAKFFEDEMSAVPVIAAAPVLSQAPHGQHQASWQG